MPLPVDALRHSRAAPAPAPGLTLQVNASGAEGAGADWQHMSASELRAAVKAGKVDPTAVMDHGVKKLQGFLGRTISSMDKMVKNNPGFAKNLSHAKRAGFALPGELPS